MSVTSIGLVVGCHRRPEERAWWAHIHRKRCRRLGRIRSRRRTGPRSRRAVQMARRGHFPATVPVEAVWSADAQGKAALVMKTRADALKTTVLVGDADILDDRTKSTTRWLDRLQGRADPDDVLMEYTVERSQFLTSDPAL